MKYWLISVLLLLSGCTTFQPELGMSLDEWKSQCRARTLVGAEDNVRVYNCARQPSVHVFENDELVRIVPTDSAPASNDAALTDLSFIGLGLMEQGQPYTLPAQPMSRQSVHCQELIGGQVYCR